MINFFTHGKNSYFFDFVNHAQFLLKFTFQFIQTPLKSMNQTQASNEYLNSPEFKMPLQNALIPYKAIISPK